MKPFKLSLMATMALLCLNLNVFAFQSPTLPYDLFFVGIDSDINSIGDDQLILMTSRDITSGYQFGLSNGLSDNGDWVSREIEMEYINITYLGSDVIPKGAVLKLDISSSALQIESDEKSITGDFLIRYSTNYNGDFVKSSSFYVSVFNGMMTGSGSKHFLLGSTLDVLAYGISQSEAQALKLSRSVDNKEVLVSTQTGSSIAKRVDYQNCDLCDILLLILYSDEWLNLPNTFGFDLSAIPLDIRNCIQVDCGGQIEVDTLDCYNLAILSVPCDTIVSYEWTKSSGSQFIVLESGTSGPIPDFTVKEKVLHQLTVVCSNGCVYDYEYFPGCWEYDCDFDISIEANNCVLSVTMSGCPNPEYQWHVSTEDGAFAIANSNAASIIAEENGTYFVKILGCPNCEVASSDTLSVNCGEECNCSIDFYEDGCLLYLNETDCTEYIGELFYSPDFGMNWYFINVSSFPFDPSGFGNGMYKYVMTNSDCEDIESEVYVECNTSCDIIYLTSSLNQECNLIFNWLDCTNPELQILYANDCSTYSTGGANLISLVTLPDGSGWAEYETDHSTGCYQLQLLCFEKCELKSDSIEVDDCCTSDFEITETDCTITGINIPCTGTFTYTLFENGIAIQSGQGTSLPDFNVSNNSIYQITIECAGCIYYSDAKQLNCGGCNVIPLLSIEDCILIATVDNCANPQIQWQILENGTWLDIQGANGNTYEIDVDGTYQYIVSGCGCSEEPLDSEDYYSSCFLPCDCYIDISLDTVNCIINSVDPNCNLIISTEWFVFIDNEWLHLPQFSGQNTITPDFNGTYRKEIDTKDCGVLLEEIVVPCNIACEDLDVWLVSNECSIIVQWEGCYGQNSFSWTMTPTSLNCGSGGSPTPANYTIESQSGYPLQGTGSMEIIPEVDGCYTFTLICNDNCTDSISTNFTKCCAPDAEIVLDQDPDELCDYCFVNEDTEELLEIYVEIDGVEVELSTYTDYFNFPYCDDSGSITCDPSLPTFVDLVNDVNAWFTAFGFEGEAFNGNGAGVCKGINTPFWIQQSNVVFKYSYLYESGPGYQVQDFLSDIEDCTVSTSGPILKVINACLGAEYLWSTGDTTYSIPFIPGPNYSVTITCPDSCTTTIGFIPPLPLNSLEKIIAEEVGEKSEGNVLIQEVNFKAYPNPARERFEIAFNSLSIQSLQLNIYNTSGQLIESIPIHPKVGQNKNSISTDKYQNGLFILELRGENNSLGYQKIVIVK